MSDVIDWESLIIGALTGGPKTTLEIEAVIMSSPPFSEQHPSGLLPWKLYDAMGRALRKMEARGNVLARCGRRGRSIVWKLEGVRP